MGNWRTVHLIGTCAASEVGALRLALEAGEDYQNFHCLSSGISLFGLGDWAAEKIDRIGNLAERGYSVQDIADQLGKLLLAAPSLTLKAHCGGDWEDPVVVATITVQGGAVTVGAPEMRELGQIPTSQVTANLYQALRHD